MDEMTSRPPRWHWLMLVTIALAAGASVVVEIHRYGPGLSPDSAVHLAAARNIGHGDIFRKDGERLSTSWPPGYPAAIAATRLLLNERTETAAGHLGVACMVAVVLMAGVWVKQRSGSLVAGVAAQMLLLGSPTLHHVCNFAWSEGPFVAFTTASLWSLVVLSRRPGVGRALLVGLLVALAWQVRYIGIALLATAVAAMLARGGLSLRRRIGLAAAVAFLPVASMGAWMARNYALTGSIGGERIEALVGLWVNLQRAGNWLAVAVWPWTDIPASADGLLAGGLAAALVAVFLAGVAVVLRNWKRGGLGDEWICVLFLGVYLCAQLAVSSIVHIDAIGTRLLSPLVAPGVVLAVLVATRLIRRARAVSSSKRPAAVLGAVALTGWLVMILAADAVWLPGSLAYTWRNGAGGYNSTAWQQSPVLVWMRANHPEGLLLSNESLATTTVLRRQAFGLPMGLAGAKLGDEELARLMARSDPLAGRSGAWLVWHTDAEQFPNLPTLEQLRRYWTIEPVVTLAGGAVYRVAPRTPATAPAER